MNIIKLTSAYTDQPVWINADKIEVMNRKETGTPPRTEIQIKCEEWKVYETPEQIIKLASQDKQTTDTIFKAQTRAALEQLKDDIELLQEYLPKEPAMKKD